MAYMIAGYLIIWLAVFAFVLSLVRRQSNLQREITALKELLAERQARQS